MSFFVRATAVAGGLALFAAALPAVAQTQQPSAPAAGVVLSPAWTRATPPGARVGGGFFTIDNKGPVADRLVSATSEVSNTVEIHEMAVIDGIMRMRALEKGLDIGAGARRELKPGSYHIMFIDLKRPLKAGETVKGELVFEKAGKMPVEYKVMPIGSTSGAMNQHGH